MPLNTKQNAKEQNKSLNWTTTFSRMTFIRIQMEKNGFEQNDT